MRYLGVEYYWDAYFQIYISEKRNYLDLENIKKDIRKKVLPTYKPTKTLEWLKNMTDHEWFYHDRSLECETNEYVYFLDDGICYIDKNGYLIIDDDDIVESFEVTLTPREFIEKIAKGEWV